MDLLKGGIELKGEIEQANIVLVLEYPIPSNTKGRTLVKGRKLAICNYMCPFCI